MANTFHLKIVTVDGLAFEGDVQKVTFRSTHGDLAIMARHINYCTPIGMGTARVLLEDGTERTAACIGGMCSMMENECHLLPTTWEWSEEIDVERAEAAKERAEAVASYLIGLGVRDEYHIFTQGKGSKEPVASNKTEEGRAKNRRVEITIMD